MSLKEAGQCPCGCQRDAKRNCGVEAEHSTSTNVEKVPYDPVPLISKSIIKITKKKIENEKK